MGFKRLSKGKPLSSPSNKRKAKDADPSNHASEKLESITPAKEEKSSAAKRISRHVAEGAPPQKNDALKRKLIIEKEEEEEWEPEQNDDMNNAAGALGSSSANPSSGTGVGTGPAGGTSPSSVSTAAALLTPTKKQCIYSDANRTPSIGMEISAVPPLDPELSMPMPSQTTAPAIGAGISQLPFLPFLPLMGLMSFQGLMPPLPFPFAAVQQPPLPQPQQQQPSPPHPTTPVSPPSTILELTPVQKAVLDHATTTGQDAAQIWTAARQIALKYTAQQLLKTFAAPFSSTPSPSLPPATTTKVTAGVSYVVRSESKQIEVSDQDILPHMVYRPPAPAAGLELSETAPEVAAALEILLNQQTLAVSMPLKDENAMKTYLLEHDERAALIDAAEGTIMELEGAGNVAELCQDRSFVCLHYKLEQPEIGNSTTSNHMKLIPCLPTASTLATEAGGTGLAPYNEDTAAPELKEGGQKTVSSSSAAAPLAASNVQLGIMIRKGVGGTYPLRSAARKLHAQGLLGALMDESLPTATPTPAVNGASPAQEEAENGAINLENNNTQEVNGASSGNEAIPASNPSETAALAPGEGPAPAHQRLSLYTLSCRLELYIDETIWEKLDSHTRLVLQITLYHLEHRLRAQFEKRNWDMLKTTMCKKLETLLADATNETGLGEEGGKDSTEAMATNESGVESRNALESALAAKLLPLFSLPDSVTKPAETEGVVPYSASSSSLPPFGKDLGMDFSLALVLSASCLSTESHALHHMPWPLYCINTRDCFTHHLVPIHTTMHAPEGRIFTKTEWFFRAGQLPADYQAVLQRCALTKTGESTGNARKCDFAAAVSGENSEIAGVLANMVDALCEAQNENRTDEGEKSSLQHGFSVAGPSSQAATAALPPPPTPNTTISAKNTPVGALFPVGVTTYNEIFSPTQLTDIETRCDSIDTASRQGRLPATCSHSTLNKAGGLKRTKFFFGARYLWTREQLAAPDAHVAKGVRVDVPPAPKWVEAVVESPLVAAAVLPADHINSVALNMYHDGSEGIQVHFDDSARFQQPIFSLRLFSDSRLSFGTQLYGYTNGSFFIPMPRGCVTVMEAGSYAANGVKHCVRPVDMAGKSAGMILRRMNPSALAEAREHFMEETIDWMQCLSLNASLRAESLLGQGITELAFGNRYNSNHYRSAGQHGVRGAPGSKTMRQVAKVMECMLRSIEDTEWKERIRETTVASVMARMVHRVELADSAGVNLVEKEDASVFKVVDSMVSCCEIVSAPPQTASEVARFRRKFLPPRPFFSSNAGLQGEGNTGGGKGSRGPYKKRPRGLQDSLELRFNKHFKGGSGSVLPDAVVVALTINRMISAIESMETKSEIAAVAQVFRRMVSCVEALST